MMGRVKSKGILRARLRLEFLGEGGLIFRGRGWLISAFHDISGVGLAWSHFFRFPFQVVCSNIKIDIWL